MPPATGSVLASRVPTTGLVLDLVLGSATVRTLRTPLLPTSRKALTLADPSTVHATVFDRRVPTDAGALADRLALLPTKTRLDAVRLFTEWAAWRGAENAAEVGAACLDADCVPLAEALTHTPLDG